MNKNITNIGRLTISVLLVIGLIYIVGLEKIISTISKFNIFFIPIVFFLMFVTLALSGFNLKLLFNAKSQIKRNCVNPKLGLHVFNMAFKEKQVTL